MRTSPHWGIGPDRILAELFELWLVSRIFGLGRLLPDGQCGLWALSRDAAGELTLTASRFEVELDLLSEVLRRSIELRYVPVEVSPPDGTAFRPHDHVRKLLFLAKKFRLSPDSVEDEFRGFSEWAMERSGDLEEVQVVELPSDLGRAQEVRR